MSTKPSYLADSQVTADVVVFTVDERLLKVLLIRRDDAPFKGAPSLPGGFLHKNETSDQTALRVLKAKAHVQDVFSEQLYTFDDPKRDPRGHIITIAHFALVPTDKLITRRLAKNAEIKPVNEVNGLAFDHDQILAYAVRRLRTKLGYSNIAYSLLPKLFTLSQLQEVYEVILGHTVDKRNFRKKILSLGIIEPTAQQLTGQKHRPARLFKFKKHSYAELEEPLF